MLNKLSNPSGISGDRNLTVSSIGEFRPQKTAAKFIGDVVEYRICSQTIDNDLGHGHFFRF